MAKAGGWSAEGRDEGAQEEGERLEGRYERRAERPDLLRTTEGPGTEPVRL